MSTDLLTNVHESTPKPFRPALRYHGGKWVLAPWIIKQFPPHRIYCEPFCGAASVLLRKPRSHIEIINDLDGEVVNLFNLLRNPDDAKILALSLALTPYSREEFERSYQPGDSSFERARRLVCRSFFGFGSQSHNPANSNGFRASKHKPYAIEWGGIPAAIVEIAERLIGVMVERRPAREILARYDGEDTLFFLDPPYPAATRNCGNKGYVHEMSDADHRELAYVAKSLTGRVILCGYPCGLYDGELYREWYRIEKPHYSNGQKGRSETTEVLWMNFQPATA